MRRSNQRRAVGLRLNTPCGRAGPVTAVCRKQISSKPAFTRSVMRVVAIESTARPHACVLVDNAVRVDSWMAVPLASCSGATGSKSFEVMASMVGFERDSINVLISEKRT